MRAAFTQTSVETLTRLYRRPGSLTRGVRERLVHARAPSPSRARGVRVRPPRAPRGTAWWVCWRVVSALPVPTTSGDAAPGAVPPKVLVGMSGGVDSSVAAALLADRGFDVVGSMLRFWPDDRPEGAFDLCCSPDAAYDARRVAD